MSQLSLSPLTSWEVVLASTAPQEQEVGAIISDAPQWLHLLSQQAHNAESDLWAFKQAAGEAVQILTAEQQLMKQRYQQLAHGLNSMIAYHNDRSTLTIESAERLSADLIQSTTEFGNAVWKEIYAQQKDNTARGESLEETAEME
jgi:hypothetical protein